MTNLYTIGTPVLDVIFKQGKAHNSNLAGAILNTTTTLQRLHTNAKFCTVTGADKVGDMFMEFFKKNNYSLEFISQSDKMQSVTAMAFIDENKNASYMFYGEFKPELVNLPQNLGSNDIVYIGDFVSLFPNYSNIINRIPPKALVYYDPNVRGELNDDQFQQLMMNISRANILRMSCDDLDLINKKINVLEEIKKNHPHIYLILITYNDKVTYILNGQEKTIPIKKIEPVNTIGAGDNFNAGFLYGFKKFNLNTDNLCSQVDDIEQSIHYGVKVAQHICMSEDVYVEEGYMIE